MAQCIVPNGMQYAVNSAIAERDRQDAKWGPQDHPLPVWMAILMEEVGELSECVLHAQFGGHAAPHLRKEAVQVAAVALALVQAIDEGRAWNLGHTPDGHTAGKPDGTEGWGEVKPCGCGPFMVIIGCKCGQDSDYYTRLPASLAPVSLDTTRPATAALKAAQR